MKNLTSKKRPLYKQPIFIGTIFINLSLFIGLYLYFRTDILQTLATSHLVSHQTVQTNDTPSIYTAKNIPLSSPTVELIPQITPTTAQVTSTVSVTALPTLREADTVAKSATATTPITVTNIVKIPQKTTNSVDDRDESPQTGKKFAKSSPKLAHHSSNSQTIAEAQSYNKPNLVEPHHPTDSVLTDRDIPTQHRVGRRNESLAQHDLEAKTAQLSDAINQVKRLNQQTIDKTQTSKTDDK